MELVREDRRFLLYASFALLLPALLAAWIAAGLGGARATLWVDDGATPLAAGLACVLCLRARSRHEGRMRLFFTLLGCATASWTIAEVIWGVYALILDREVPSPSWADVGYLSAIPLTVAALIVHPAVRGNGRRKARSVLDGTVLAAALLFLSWTLVLGPLWRSSDLGTAGGIVTVAYPFGDVVMVFFIVLAIHGMTGGDRRSLWCLLAGLLAMALSDSTYTYLSEIDTYSSSSAHVIDAGWVAAYLGMALAAFSSHPGSAVAPKAAHSKPSLASLVAPLLPVLLALGVAAVQIRLGHRLDHAAWLMAFGLIALVLTRQGLMAFELLAPSRDANAHLMQRLTQAALGAATGGEGTGSRP